MVGVQQRVATATSLPQTSLDVGGGHERGPAPVVTCLTTMAAFGATHTPRRSLES
uniref:Uncharacterized protein n=1 Tax=Hyaloperonospora arabidopsidis (strain Emoy2) TaxID=559515 RepID=M4B7B9_HYAAE